MYSYWTVLTEAANLRIMRGGWDLQRGIDRGPSSSLLVFRHSMRRSSSHGETKSNTPTVSWKRHQKLIIVCCEDVASRWIGLLPPSKKKIQSLEHRWDKFLLQYYSWSRAYCTALLESCDSSAQPSPVGVAKRVRILLCGPITTEINSVQQRIREQILCCKSREQGSVRSSSIPNFYLYSHSHWRPTSAPMREDVLCSWRGSAIVGFSSDRFISSLQLGFRCGWGFFFVGQGPLGWEWTTHLSETVSRWTKS